MLTITVYTKNEQGSVNSSFESPFRVIDCPFHAIVKTNECKGPMCNFGDPSANYYVKDILGYKEEWFCLDDRSVHEPRMPGFAYVKVSDVRELLSKK